MNKMIPSEVIHTDESGNAVIGKNVKIDGTTKLNGGLNPIHTYNLLNYTFEVLFEKHVGDSTEHIFFGYIVYDDGTSVPCMGMYSISNNRLTSFSAISYDTIYSWNEGETLQEKTIATNP